MAPLPGSGVRSGLSPRRRRRPTSLRLASYVLLLLGLALFNWWLALPWLVERDRMFDRLLSDATAVGAPNAAGLRAMEAVGAVLLLLSLLLRGPLDRDGATRRDWWCAVVLVVFELSNAVFVESCQSGTDLDCFDRELRFGLPWFHYAHIVSGIVEWGAALLLAWFGWRRLQGAARGSIYGWLLVYAAFILTPLAIAFMTHRLFSVVEFTVYVAFSIALFLTVTEPGPEQP